MVKREFRYIARIPDGHHQDWNLFQKVVKEIKRLTSEWPAAELSIDVIGSHDLNERYNSLLDAKIDLGEHMRDVLEVSICLWDHYNKPENSGYAIQMGFGDGKHEESQVYVSGPTKATCERIAKSMQSFILEKIEDTGEQDFSLLGHGKITARLDGLHPAMKNNVQKLIRGGHGDNAVEEACKSIGERIRRMTGLDKDGAALIGEALRVGGAIKFSSTGGQTDVSLQEGYMHLGMALYKAARNPRAHRPSNPNADLDEIIEWLHVASALHRGLDGAITETRL